MFRDDHEENRIAWEIKLPVIMVGSLFVAALAVVLIGWALILR